MLAEERDFLNYIKILDLDFDVTGKYDIPVMQPVQINLQKASVIGFNYCTQDRFKDSIFKPEGIFVHLFLPDTYIERLWKKPEYYLNVFKRFGGIIQPDCSEYLLMPQVMRIWQHYRRQWLGAYYQKNGICVIPAPCWSDEESFDYCFDGVPRKSCIAISSVGCMKNPENRNRFLHGLDRTIKTLEPTQILWYGSSNKESRELIKGIETAYIPSEQKMRISSYSYEEKNRKNS